MRLWRFALGAALAGSGLLGFLACDDGSSNFKYPAGYGQGDAEVIEGDGAAAMAARAEAAYRALEPDLVKLCAGSCHGDGGNGAPPFLKGPDTYVAVRNHPGIITEEAGQSKLTSRGAHAGPALSGANQGLGDRVTAWLQIEAEILKSKALPTTDAQPLVFGPNTIDVSKAGKNVPGSKVTFDAQKNGTIVSITKLSFVAPGSTGVRVRHPIFMIVPEGGKPTKDPVDSLSIVDQKVAAGQTAVLGPGQVFLLDWKDSNKIALAFESLDPVEVTDAGGGGGGCKSLATFQSMATPVLQGNSCLNCHNGSNTGATAALDLTKLTTDPASACGQALAKVNKADKPNSSLIKRPTTAGNGHPFTVAAGNTTAYTNGILGWANNE